MARCCGQSGACTCKVQAGSGIVVTGVGSVANPFVVTSTVTGDSGGTTDPEVVRDTIGAALVAGANVTITVNDTANTITIASTGGGGTGTTDPEVVRDTMASALVAGANVTITPSDGTDTITISSTGGTGGTTDPEVVRDTMAAALIGGAGVVITPDDTANTITIAATGDAAPVEMTSVIGLVDALDSKLAIADAGLKVILMPYGTTSSDVAALNLGPNVLVVVSDTPSNLMVYGSVESDVDMANFTLLNSGSGAVTRQVNGTAKYGLSHMHLVATSSSTVRFTGPNFACNPSDIFSAAFWLKKPVGTVGTSRIRCYLIFMDSSGATLSSQYNTSADIFATSAWQQVVAVGKSSGDPLCTQVKVQAQVETVVNADQLDFDGFQLEYGSVLPVFNP